MREIAQAIGWCGELFASRFLVQSVTEVVESAISIPQDSPFSAAAAI